MNYEMQVGSFPSVCGAESLSSLLEEVTLLKHCNTWGGSDPITRDAACQHFRYFVTQNSIVLALLEQPLSNNQGIYLTDSFLFKILKFYIHKKIFISVNMTTKSLFQTHNLLSLL